MAKKKKEENFPKDKKIIEVDFKETLEESYLDYAFEVLGDRAVPDIRDGLKPVQRRIIYDMNDLNIHYTSQYKKCGRIVGDTMGKSFLY